MLVNKLHKKENYELFQKRTSCEIAMQTTSSIFYLGKLQIDFIFAL